VSHPYAETLSGSPIVRCAPGARHERICARLHQHVQASLANLASARLLAPRSEVRPSAECALRPDLSLITAATGKLWLAAEIVDSVDHRPDTVIKKQIYEELRLPRLWIIDPRYDNVEVYHATQHGMVLKGILAGRDVLTEKLLPEFKVAIAELFAA